MSIVFTNKNEKVVIWGSRLTNGRRRVISNEKWEMINRVEHDNDLLQTKNNSHLCNNNWMQREKQLVVQLFFRESNLFSSNLKWLQLNTFLCFSVEMNVVGGRGRGRGDHRGKGKMATTTKWNFLFWIFFFKKRMRSNDNIVLLFDIKITGNLWV